MDFLLLIGCFVVIDTISGLPGVFMISQNLHEQLHCMWSMEQYNSNYYSDTYVHVANSRVLCKYHSVPGKHPLPGKHPCRVSFKGGGGVGEGGIGPPPPPPPPPPKKKEHSCPS